MPRSTEQAKPLFPAELFQDQAGIPDIEDLRDLLVEHYEVEHYGLVVSIALNYISPRIQILDLIQEGYEGVLEAKKRFKPEFKTQFSTYATYWIECYMMKAIRETHIIVSSEYTYLLLKKIQDYRANCTEEPSLSEIAEALEKSETVIENALRRMRHVISVDSITDQHPNLDDRLFIQPSEHHEFGDPQELWLKKEKVETWQQFLEETVSAREEKVIKALHGQGEHTMTKKELAEKYGCSVSNITKIYSSGLKKLWMKLRATGQNAVED
ncbi:MAG: sigma-70 family RNA polymerase sigma factor [Patescibacteria group bacterium]